jgi:hypothetical protein
MTVKAATVKLGVDGLVGRDELLLFIPLPVPRTRLLVNSCILDELTTTSINFTELNRLSLRIPACSCYRRISRACSLFTGARIGYKFATGCKNAPSRLKFTETTPNMGMSAMRIALYSRASTRDKDQKPDTTHAIAGVCANPGRECCQRICGSG